MSWMRTTEMLLGVSFEICLRRRGDILIVIPCYVVVHCHDLPIKRLEDLSPRRLGDVPPRRQWVFCLRLTCNVAGTYRETSLQRRHNVLLPGGIYSRTIFIFLMYRYMCIPLWIVPWNFVTTIYSALIRLFHSKARVWPYKNKIYVHLKINVVSRHVFRLATSASYSQRKPWPKNPIKFFLLIAKYFLRILFSFRQQWRYLIFPIFSKVVM